MGRLLALRIYPKVGISGIMKTNWRLWLMARNTNTLIHQCRILKEYASDGDCIRLIECDGKLFWHITSHGEVKICEEVGGVVMKT